MKKIILKLKIFISFIIFFIKLSIIYIIINVCKINYNVWLISERGDEARDNSFFFFLYLNKYHPEIKSYFVISRNSSDYLKVKKIGNTVQPNSMKHYFLYCCAEIRISAHAYGADMPKPIFMKIINDYNIFKKKFVFLQHGIIKDDLPSLKYPIFKPDIFICGAKPEYDYVKNNFLHPNNIVKYTGLARFDYLINNCNKSKIILIMPTFRKWLQSSSIDDFLRSKYYLTWQSLLNNKKLLFLLKENNIKLIFYPHYIFQKYLKYFKSGSENIILASANNYDIQDLLKQANLLITDYSSVFFDFGYMRKCVLYYQFDVDDYIEKHYNFKNGYFEYETMGFGDVIYNEIHMIKSIEQMISNNFQISSTYKDRCNAFFTYTDNHNCERIYNEIIKLLDMENIIC